MAFRAYEKTTGDELLTPMDKKRVIWVLEDVYERV